MTPIQDPFADRECPCGSITHAPDQDHHKWQCRHCTGWNLFTEVSSIPDPRYTGTVGSEERDPARRLPAS